MEGKTVFRVRTPPKRYSSGNDGVHEKKGATPPPRTIEIAPKREKNIRSSFFSPLCIACAWGERRGKGTGHFNLPLCVPVCTPRILVYTHTHTMTLSVYNIVCVCVCVYISIYIYEPCIYAYIFVWRFCGRAGSLARRIILMENALNWI